MTAATPGGNVTLGDVWGVLLDVRDRLARVETTMGEYRRLQDERDSRCATNERAITDLRLGAARHIGATLEGRRLVGVVIAATSAGAAIASVIVVIITRW
jgi:hypothetical protein